MAKKQPIKNDDATINFRISKELKAEIEKKAVEKNVTTSAYLRELLEKVHNGDYCHHEVIKSRIYEFLFSREFLQLMIWIYSKKINSDKAEGEEELNNYVKTLKRIEGHLPNDLVREFDKVLFDIYRIRDDKYNKYYSFHSYSSDGSRTFSLEKVEKFLLNNFKLYMFIGSIHQKSKYPTN
ncbi:hypothetical protein [Xanthomarina sp. GH4-25]|uniref:hypothetical protein n=1 Tax=Xanthomarina sp. GH4-25 TaxID=3349335 RepID=UPI000D67C27F|nr:hypothetical protein DI383_14205 [Flavobacteriaceae bacterium LYZ1037]